LINEIHDFIWQVGPLKRGINPPSIKELNFDKRYIAAALRAGVISAILALAVSVPNFPPPLISQFLCGFLYILDESLTGRNFDWKKFCCD